MRNQRLISFLLGIIFLALLIAPVPVLSRDTSVDLATSIQQLTKKYGLSESKTGIKIVSLKDNKVIYEKDVDKRLVVASNVKLFTTASALCLLGPDFKYTTTLYRRGAIVGGVFKGSLIIKSNGDPNLSGRFHKGDTTAVFQAWAKRLRNLRAKSIRGKIILDDTAFDREYVVSSWPADEFSYWYCAQISGVSFNDNCVDITVYFDTSANRIKYTIDPPTKYVTIINQCMSVSKKSLHRPDFYRQPGTNTITIKGKFWEGADPHKESVTVDNPALYFGTVLKEALRKKGIQVAARIQLADKTYDKKEDHLVEIASSETDLSDTIAVTNKRSQNFYSEQILKSLGYRFKGQGSFANGLSVVKKFLADKLKMPKDSYQMVDGSGLSDDNRFTTAQIIGLLAYMARHRDFETFRDSLATPGADSLKKRLMNYKDRVWAKTGYIQGACSFSGYLRTAKGKYYAFAIVINKPGLSANRPADLEKAKRFQDEVVKKIIQIAD